MAEAVIMPKLGQTVEEAAIVKWHKAEGNKVTKGDVLFEIETDKAVLEVESFYDGILLKVLVEEGVTVPVSSTVGFIGEKGDKIPDVAPVPVSAPSAEIPKSEPVVEKVSAEVSSAVVPVSTSAVATAPVRTPVVQHPTRLFISPKARLLAKNSAIDPVKITGSGPAGRIVVKDVKSYLEANGYADMRISPTAKKMAVKEDIDILHVRGTGVSGRIMVHDVKRAIAEKPQKMSKMRQVIAQRLTESFTTTPHFYVTVSVDMTELLAYRQELKDSGAVYSVTDFIMESVVMSLQEFPVLNSVTDGKTLRWHGSVDLGMAVSLDDGLVVPVIRNAEELGMNELHDVAKDLAVRAREGRLLPDEMTGSTFTLSNMGMMDVESFNAIVNPGESAILAVASTIATPVVRAGAVVVRSIMKMTLSTDHRAVDGRAGAEFINAIKNKLEDVELWKSLT